LKFNVPVLAVKVVHPDEKVPPTLITPVLEKIISVFAPPAFVQVKFPVQFTDPVEIVILVVLVDEVTELIDILPTVKIPAPTAIVLVELAVVVLDVNAPLTVNVIALLIVSVFVALPAGAFNVNEVQEDEASTVTLWPEAITTASPAPGTTPPTQVPVALQFPVAAEVMVAAFENEIEKNIKKRNSPFCNIRGKYDFKTFFIIVNSSKHNK